MTTAGRTVRADRAGSAAALILAAGAGARLGGPKALLWFQGRLLVERAVEAAGSGGCGRIVVVLGAGADEVMRRADLGPARSVLNRGWSEGMGSSLRAGLAALDAPPDGAPADAALVLLVDQPFVGAAAVRAVLAAWRAGARLAAASYGGRRGHPVLFAREHWAAVARAATGDAGARGFLASHAAQVLLVPCDAVADPQDLDTPEDLDRLARPGTPGA
ncbi:nucleotidyltransferase family protein [Actinocrinis puniceicyclus]|uniref:Nucleotidyltransferase family protein n=1 Tax=Actinocrinis puniceicyclus TaxID=977794 RepID=A0A8J8BD90_9ACTN|nr:nucleotidyltransferase family protein [Actinocrinis puniceicyclus]MBS2965003.1 nucleotidyltransferase family protein [Actinocrinis puniceicyclus]